MSDLTTPDANDTPHRPASPRRLPVLPWILLAVLLAMLAARYLGPSGGESPQQSDQPPSSSSQIVQLTIDYGDGVQKHFASIPWRKGMTVADVLKLAAEHPRGIRTKSQGSGEMTLLTRIDGLQNQGGGQDARNWIYRINGKMAQKSFAAYRVEPSDQIVWAFEPLTAGGYPE